MTAELERYEARETLLLRLAEGFAGVEAAIDALERRVARRHRAVAFPKLRFDPWLVAGASVGVAAGGILFAAFRAWGSPGLLFASLALAPFCARLGWWLGGR